MISRRKRGRVPGMTEIAEKAGVSIATVSRALKKPDVVRPETVAKVRAVAESLGYGTSNEQQAQTSPRTGTVGLILPTIENSIFSEMISSFSHNLSILNRTLLVAAHNYDDAEEVRILRSMLERRIDGVVLIGNQHDPAVEELAKAAQIPVIEAWNHRPGATFSTVGTDNELAGYMIAEHCLKRGHKDFVLVFPDQNKNDRALLRRQGALRALKEWDVGLEPQNDLMCPYDIESAKQLGIQILKSTKHRTYICGNDVIALGILFAAQALGLQVPADLSVVGVGDFAFARSTEPGLTTVRVPARTIGREAAELINRMIERPVSKDFPSLLIQPRVIDRESCR